jgi:hypothetical protein
MSLKTLLTLSIVLVSIASFSQDSLRFGIKAGGNLSGLHTKSSAHSGGTGFHSGAVAEYQVSTKFALSAELLYNQKGGTYRVSSNPFTTVDANLNYISVPILGKINITKKFQFEIGPEVSFLIGEDYSYGGSEIVEFAEAKKLDFAGAGGLSYEFNSGLFIQGRYIYGLSKIYDERDYGNACASLSLGYFFM